MKKVSVATTWMIGLSVLFLSKITFSAPNVINNDGDDNQRVRLLIGVFSVAKDRDRRDAMRETWIKKAKDIVDTSIEVRFVLGKTDAHTVAGENEKFQDLVILDCEENQHKGKTLLWFEKAFDLFPSDRRPHFFVEMDQDVFVWPRELAAHAALFPRKNFYAGHGPLYTNRRFGGNDRFPFFNGGFVLLSEDMVARIRSVLDIARPFQNEESRKRGFVVDVPALRGNHDIDLRGNEDVALGRIFKPLSNTILLNGGLSARFPWSLGEYGPIPNVSPPSEDVSKRSCPWRHSKDLKTAEGYRWFAASGSAEKHECRCNCRPKGPFIPKMKKKPQYDKRKRRYPRRAASSRGEL